MELWRACGVNEARAVEFLLDETDFHDVDMGDHIATQWTMPMIKKANKDVGLHWFDKSTMDAFNSRIEAGPYQGQAGIFFVSSESMGTYSDGTVAPRRFGVRRFFPRTGRIYDTQWKSVSRDGYTNWSDHKGLAVEVAKQAAHGIIMVWGTPDNLAPPDQYTEGFDDVDFGRPVDKDSPDEDIINGPHKMIVSSVVEPWHEDLAKEIDRIFGFPVIFYHVQATTDVEITVPDKDAHNAVMHFLIQWNGGDIHVDSVSVEPQTETYASGGLEWGDEIEMDDDSADEPVGKHRMSDNGDGGWKKKWDTHPGDEHPPGTPGHVDVKKLHNINVSGIVGGQSLQELLDSLDDVSIPYQTVPYGGTTELYIEAHNIEDHKDILDILKKWGANFAYVTVGPMRPEKEIDDGP